MNFNKKLIILPVLAILIISSFATINWINYQNGKQFTKDTQSYCPSGYIPVTVSPNYLTRQCARVIITITHPEQTFASLKLLSEGYNASCLYFCHGITYSYDPTAIMVNNGHDFMFNCKDFGVSQAVYCHVGKNDVGLHDNATSMELSTSSTALAVTDTGCGGGSGSGQITTGGLADVLGTFTAGTPSAGSVTSTLAHTWTAAEADNNVQVLCINTELHTGSHIILVYEFTFGPDSLISGNTLAITASLTAT